MNKYQRLIDGAEVREMHDPTTGGSLHGALYGDTKSHRAFVQPLPLFSNIGSSDRAVQAAALAELTGAKVLQITSNGFRGSSLRPSHLRGYLTGNMSPHAWSVDSVLHKDRPLGDVPPQEAVFIGESLAAATTSKLGRLGIAKQLVLIEACGMSGQSQFGLLKRLLIDEFSVNEARRAALVNKAINGLVLPNNFSPSFRKGISSLPINPLVALCMLTPGFGSEAAFSDLDAGLSEYKDLRISGRSAEKSLAFPNPEVIHSYQILQSKHGSDRVFYGTITGESHYTATADPEVFAALVQEQTAEILGQ